MDTCIFCRIAKGEIPARKVYEDEHVVAFHDLAPQAPVHVLVIPKQHCDGALNAGELDNAVLGHMFLAVAEAAKKLGVDKTGFRIVINTGADACQSVPHLHMHMLGGKKLPDAIV